MSLPLSYAKSGFKMARTVTPSGMSHSCTVLAGSHKDDIPLLWLNPIHPLRKQLVSVGSSLWCCVAGGCNMLEQLRAR